MRIGFTEIPASLFKTAFKPKWKSLVITLECLDSSSGSNAFVKFLTTNCRQLEYFQTGIDKNSKIVHLNNILKGLTQVKELKLFCHGSTHGLTAVLAKHLHRLSNPNFKLSINFVTVLRDLQNLEPIYELNENERYEETQMALVEQDGRLNFNRREFYDSVHKILLDEDHYRELVQFETHRLHLKRIDYLNVWKDRMDIDLNRFLNTVPNSISLFTLRTLDPLPQYMLDAIPTLFPRLYMFSLNNLGNSTPDLKFLRKLTYLSELKLKEFTFSYVNRDDLFNAVEHGHFLSVLNVEYLTKSPEIFLRQIKPQLMVIFERKALTNPSIKYETNF